MAAIDDAKSLINILKRGGTSTNPQLLRIAAQFQVYAGSAFIAVDPINPTNEELAENILLMFRRFGRSVVRAQAEKGARSDNDAVVDAAADTAEADL